VSVDTHTGGRRLDGYTSAETNGITILVDPDLARLPIEVTVHKAGLLGRGVSVQVDGIDGAPCPIDLVR